jgi:hypothetical protein
MNKNRCFLLVFSCLLLLLPDALQLCYAQSSLETDPPATSTYVVNTNSTHFWVNDNLWLSTNATYTIQNAFDNLPLQGGRVFLKAGVYPVNGIYITNKAPIDDSPYQQIIFEGEGRQVATLKLIDNATGASSKLEVFPDYANKAVIWCEPCSVDAGLRVTLSNIGVDGNRKNQQTEIAGIAVYNDWDSVVEDNYLYECGGHGIMHLGSRWLRTAYIRGNYVYFTDLSGQNPGAPQSPLECYLSGIVSWRTDVAIRENTVGWTGYRGENCFLGIGVSACFALVENNWVWGNYIGVLISNGQFFSLTDNFIESNVNGVYLWNAHCGTIQSNNIQLYCNPDTGIKIGGNSSYNNIKLNKIWARNNQTAQYGIREMNTADYNTICDNNIIAKNHTFISDVTSDAVGAILTPIFPIGTHSTVSGNIIDQEIPENPTQTPTPTPTHPSSPSATSTPTQTATLTPPNSDQPDPTPSSVIPEYTPWSLLIILFAGTTTATLIFKKTKQKGMLTKA